jgi:hypothetical protein
LKKMPVNRSKTEPKVIAFSKIYNASRVDTHNDLFVKCLSPVID